MSSQRNLACDPEVMSVLENNQVTIDNKRITLKDAIALEKDDRPSMALAIKLSNVLVRSGLSIKQKSDLFTFAGWDFMCIGCHKTQAPAEFDGKAFYFWGPTEPVRVLLRSGPCKTCYSTRDGQFIRSEIERFKVVPPPGCQ